MLILFRVFAKRTSFVKAVKKVRNPRPGGAVFMNIAENTMPRRKETSMGGEKKREKAKSG